MGSETKLVPSLSSSLVRALAEIGGAAKDKVNPHFKSKYADLASVVDAIKPILAKHGLAFTQGTEPSEGGVVVETFVWSADSEPHSLGKLYVPANKQDAQGFGSALTYARRYSLMTAFGVPAEDDDGNAAAASARANPRTGETPPEKRVPLDGPYTSKTALWAAVKAFDRTVRGIGDHAELIAFLDTQDAKDLIEQCKRDAPGLWSEGIPDVPEFVPLEILVAQQKRDLEQSDNIHNILHAG